MLLIGSKTNLRSWTMLCEIFILKIFYAASQVFQVLLKTPLHFGVLSEQHEGDKRQILWVFVDNARNCFSTDATMRRKNSRPVLVCRKTAIFSVERFLFANYRETQFIIRLSLEKNENTF